MAKQQVENQTGHGQELDSLQARIFHRYQQMCIRRDGWRNIYWMLSKYLFLRPIYFADTDVPYRTPRISVKDVHDDTAVTAAGTCATALGGALWPNTAESFDLRPHMPRSLVVDDDFILQSEEVKKYFERVTKIVRSAIDSPESGFQSAFGEHLADQVVFGTSGILADERTDDDDCPVRFRSATIETCVFDEGPDGLIDTGYYEHMYTVRQVVEIYGKDKVSPGLLEKYESGKLDEWIKVLQALEPRTEIEPNGDPREKQNKPYASIHMEWNSKHILKRDGMDERPLFVTRFEKRPNEILGRSLGMKALATIKEFNLLRKGYSKALDKKLDPPLGFYADQLNGGAQADISAGAKNMYTNTGRLPEGRKPIEVLYDIPEPVTATARLEQLGATIDEKFLIDRLLDFNNKTRMTAKESEMRMDFRNQALGDIFSRQISELLSPLIKWVVGVLWRRKLLGYHPVTDAAIIAALRAKDMSPLVIPDAIVKIMQKNKLPFEVTFISPAARAMQADSLLGLEKLVNFIMVFMNAGLHDVVDNVDTDTMIREYQRLSGAPAHVLNGKDKVEKTRKNRGNLQQQQMQMSVEEQQAATLDKKAKAAKNFAQAGQSLPNMMGGPQSGAA